MRGIIERLHRGQAGVVLTAGLVLFILAIIGGATATFAILDRLEWGIGGPTGPTPILPDRAVGWEWSMWGCGQDSGTPASQLNAEWGIVVCPAETIQVEEFDWRVGHDAHGDKVYAIHVYTWEDADGLGTYLGTSLEVPVVSLPETTGNNQVQPWATFTFTENIVMYKDTWYTIRLKKVSGTTGEIVTTIPTGTACIGAITKGYFYDTPDDHWSSSAESDYYVKGYVSAEPDVYTIGYELNLDGSIQLYGAADVIGDMECGFLVSDDYDFVVAGNGQQYPDPGIMSGWNAGRFLFDYRLAFLQSNVQYSYCAFASAYGQTWYGDVYNFTRLGPDVPFNLRCDVIENNLDRVTFESSVVGINSTSDVVYNVTIAYGTNQTGCQASNGTIAVAYNVTSDDVWRTIVNTGTEFDEGTRYYYRLAVAGNDSSLAYSTMGSFTTWDSDQPPWLQRLIQWINQHLDTHITIDTAYWWIIGVLFLAAWTLAGLFRWKWLGVVGTALLFVWLVVNELVPVWVVILAVLLAGWIIFKLVFTRAHEETGD